MKGVGDSRQKKETIPQANRLCVIPRCPNVSLTNEANPKDLRPIKDRGSSISGNKDPNMMPKT